MDDKPIRLPNHQLAMIILSYFICIALFFKGLYEAAMQVHNYIIHETFSIKLFMYGISRMGIAFFAISFIFTLFMWADRMHEKEVQKKSVQ